MSTALNRPNLIARCVSLLAGAAIVVVIVLLVTGGSSYVLKLRMSDASGLRPGSQVLLGGVPIGTVGPITLDRSRNDVVVELDLNRTDVHVGAGVHAGVVAANLLGEEYVSLAPGNPARPLPSGTVLPQSATTLPTDLDQIVDVLDGGTRARLAILLREAGIAVAGRQADVSAILRQFPASLQAATSLLQAMITDNHTLGDLVANSDGFISRLNAQSVDLKQAIGAASGAATTFELRSASLKQAVIGLPRFESDMAVAFDDGTTGIDSILPTVQTIDTAAPYIDQLLRQIKPFTRAAVPTLNRAAAVAPTLSKLATQATPIVKQAVPTVSSLSTVAKLAQPLSAWLGLSSQDLFNVFDGWSHAIQFRDGLGHVFNGDVYLSPWVVLGAADQGATAAQKRQNLLDVLSPGLRQTLELLPGVANVLKLPVPAAKPRKPGLSLPKLGLPLLTSKPGGSTPATGAAPAGGVSGLVGGLGKALGGVLGALGDHGHSGGSAPSSGGTSGGSSGSGGSGGQAPGSSLQNLLGYLLGK